MPVISFSVLCILSAERQLSLFLSRLSRKVSKLPAPFCRVDDHQTAADLQEKLTSPQCSCGGPTWSGTSQDSYRVEADRKQCSSQVRIQAAVEKA
ncbi:hypothetical protein JZ751_014484 [Albula glossodonta]|uniref:Uncharacterized protein n=1 Tax=Albula glossodonta TaxID=121402 RepID=A0A8T2ML76_9TELE|nr:hypothetical protein JZ751_014484 [Albula glossodonta]